MITSHAAMITAFNGPVEFLQRPIAAPRSREAAIAASEDLFSASLDLGRVSLPGKMPVSGNCFQELR